MASAACRWCLSSKRPATSWTWRWPDAVATRRQAAPLLRSLNDTHATSVMLLGQSDACDRVNPHSPGAEYTVSSLPRETAR